MSCHGVVTLAGCAGALWSSVDDLVTMLHVRGWRDGRSLNHRGVSPAVTNTTPHLYGDLLRSLFQVFIYITLQQAISATCSQMETSPLPLRLLIFLLLSPIPHPLISSLLIFIRIEVDRRRLLIRGSEEEVCWRKTEVTSRQG